MAAVEIHYNTRLAPEDYPVAVMRCPFHENQEWQIWNKPHEKDNDIIAHEKCWVIKLPKEAGR